MHKKCNLTPLLGLALLATSLEAGAAEDLGVSLVPALGRPAVDASPSVVSPDGSGLPAGRGSARRGKALYERHCVACHGPRGDMRGNELAGGHGSLATPRPLKTVGSYWPYATTLFDYIGRAMPYNQTRSLTSDETYAITAYVLFLNGIVTEATVLDRDTLRRVEMPNRSGFIELTDH